MSRRTDVLSNARWWEAWTDFRASTDDLIYFFTQARCEQVPTQAQANDAMGRDTGVNMYGQVKHWCGIFACAIWREAGLPVRWTLNGGRIIADGASGVMQYTSGRSGIQPGDIAIIPGAQHHFLIMGVDQSAQQYQTLEGNTSGQIVRTRTRPFKPTKASEVIYGYYKIR